MISSLLTSLVQKPVKGVTDVAQCEPGQIAFGHLLQTVWKVSPVVKEPELKKIPLQSEHSTSVF